jgi:hypothetical protein
MTKIVAVSVVSLFLLLAGRHAGAADKEAQVKQVTTLDDAATAAYSDGDFEKMKKQLLKALSIGKDALATDPIMARVYLHLGVLYVDGLDNRAVGVKYFGKALKIRPDIEVRSNMATKTVMTAFNEAGQQQEAAPAEEAPPPPPARASRRETAADREEEAEALRPPRAAASEKCRNNDADTTAVKKEARDELDRLDKALTMSKDALSKERAEADKYRHDKMDLERQLNEAKQRVKELENDVNAKEKRTAAGEQREKKERDAKEALAKEKTEKDSLLLATAQQLQQAEKEKAEREKQLSAGEQREKKERDANEKLEREKMDRDRALADLKLKAQQSESDLKAHSQQTENELKQRVAQLEKDKAEKEKQLAATQQREQQERQAKEKLQHDRQVADARDQERKGWEEKARTERDKLEALPPLPARIPEAVHCAVPEEVQGGADLFVNCVTQPGVRAKNIVFYYRPASSVLYNALVMDPTKKGWSRAVITANKLNGKLLQYYVEARNDKDSVAASNGKATSPNIITIAPPGRR